jgi:hypothetical protein
MFSAGEVRVFRVGSAGNEVTFLIDVDIEYFHMGTDLLDVVGDEFLIVCEVWKLGINYTMLFIIMKDDCPQDALSLRSWKSRLSYDCQTFSNLFPVSGFVHVPILMIL